MIGIIVDDLRVKKWQADALSSIADCGDFIVFSCTTSRSKRNFLRHASYYLLNALALRNRQTKSCKLPEALKTGEVVEFSPSLDGNWQLLPDRLIERIAELKPAALIKFGMGLLRVPEALGAPILSYHHGDPRRYRGRPAGFYELLNGDRVIGQVVQVITNRLDSGAVVAYGETAVHAHSYRRTMVDAYRTSPLLLGRALTNASNGVSLPIGADGPNYRLPSNSAVARCSARILRAKLSRWAYGAFFEKQWRVATAPLTDNAAAALKNFPQPANWQEISCPPHYRFLADPFPDPRGGLLAEGLRRRDGQGEIVRIANGDCSILCSGTGHFSYPVMVDVENGQFLLPEVSEWSVPLAFRAIASGSELVGALQIEGAPRLKDATPYLASDGEVFLFGNRDDEGIGILRLWVSRSLFGPFKEHPSSPIRLSPLGSRMGGSLFDDNGRLFRVGQDCTRAYGDGVALFEVTRLTNSEYAEELVGQYRFEDVAGPHTINFTTNSLIFDFYRDRFALGAGVRRIASKLRRVRSIRSATN